MDFKISRKKLQEVKEKVLNDYITGDDKNVEMFENFIVVMDQTQDEFEVYEPFFEYDYEDGRLFVRDDVFQSFQDMFSISENKAIQDISNWFSGKYNVEVKFVD